MMIEPPAPRHRPSGFTLIELIVVIILIGIMSFVALPRFDMIKGYDEVGFRDKVRATLEFARKSAVAQRRFVCAVIDASNDVTLTIESLTPEDPAHSAACPYARVLALPAVDRACSGATNKICNPGSITLTPGTLQFDPLGRPTLGAGTYTVTGDAPALTAYPIIVEAETGNVR